MLKIDISETKFYFFNVPCLFANELFYTDQKTQRNILKIKKMIKSDCLSMINSVMLLE